MVTNVTLNDSIQTLSISVYPECNQVDMLVLVSGPVISVAIHLLAQYFCANEFVY